jgi:hypothetical protein
MIFDYIDLLINLIGVMTPPEGIDIKKANPLDLAACANNNEESSFTLVYMTGEALTIYILETITTYVAGCVVTAGYLYLIGEL